jgi:hypothetical protein
MNTVPQCEEISAGARVTAAIEKKEAKGSEWSQTGWSLGPGVNMGVYFGRGDHLLKVRQE